MQPQQAAPAKLARKNVGAQSSPGLRAMPLPAEVSAAEVALSSTRPRSKLGRNLLLTGAAAVGCGLFLFQLLQGTPANPSGGVAALGALQQATPAPAPAAAIDEGSVAPAPAALQQPAETTASAPVTPSATSAPANRPSSAHRDGLEREPTPSEPGNPQQLVDEGIVLFKSGRLGLAEASYLKALKLQPAYPRAMAALVRVHIQRRDGAEAVRWAKQLVDKQPDNGVNQLLLGDALQLRGDLGGAQDAWTEAARLGNATARERL
jgi:tetratricopeptide (TPR) repeat protein